MAQATCLMSDSWYGWTGRCSSPSNCVVGRLLGQCAAGWGCSAERACSRCHRWLRGHLLNISDCGRGRLACRGGVFACQVPHPPNAKATLHCLFQAVKRGFTQVSQIQVQLRQVAKHARCSNHARCAGSASTWSSGTCRPCPPVLQIIWCACLVAAAL